jgi:hypothetical protein
VSPCQDAWLPDCRCHGLVLVIQDTDQPTHRNRHKHRERSYTQKDTQKRVRGERDGGKIPKSLHGDVELSVKLSTHTTTFTVNYLKKFNKLGFFFFQCEPWARSVPLLSSLWAKPFKYFGPAIWSLLTPKKIFQSKIFLKKLLKNAFFCHRVSRHMRQEKCSSCCCRCASYLYFFVLLFSIQI